MTRKLMNQARNIMRHKISPTQTYTTAHESLSRSQIAHGQLCWSIQITLYNNFVVPWSYCGEENILVPPQLVHMFYLRYLNIMVGAHSYGFLSYVLHLISRKFYEYGNTQKHEKNGESCWSSGIFLIWKLTT